MKLENFLGKKVEILAVYGKKLVGIVDTYTNRENSESGFDEITVETDGFDYFGINESEIKSIEIFDKKQAA